MIFLVLREFLLNLLIYKGLTEIVNQRLRCRGIVEDSNNHALDAHINDLPSSFDEYITNYKKANIGDICPYYSSVAADRTSKYLN